MGAQQDPRWLQGQPCSGDAEYPTLDPLTYIDVANARGQTILLEPPDGTNVDGSLVPLFDTYSTCARGRELSLTLGLELVGPIATFANAIDGGIAIRMVRAHVSFGLGSADFPPLVCDWVLGTEIGITTERIGVSAQYVRRLVLADGDVEPPPPDFRISAGVGYSALGRNTNGSRLTEFVYVPEADGLVRVSIPAYATSFTVVPMSDVQTAGVRLSHFGSAAQPLYVVSAPIEGVRNEGQFTIPNGMFFVDVVNLNDEPLAAMVIFGLSP